MNKITVREVIRHGLHATAFDRLLLRRRAARGVDVGYLFAGSRRQVFEQIYRQGAWLKGEQQWSRSGAGSEIEATGELRAALPGVLARLGARSLLDVGCGDFNWMREVELGVEYTGVDIVESVIRANTESHASPHRSFRCLDAVQGPLPRADAVLCREVLFHLSFADAERVLANIRSCGARHLIATSDDATGFNADIRTGDFRLLNLRRRPFTFPAPLHRIADDAVQPGRGIGVWRIEDI
ncbi:class I SAM-dependent methyltransferase [Micromonospora halophytica]|uniref:Methyltransferase domain-containing protein n=1 Tax=Micromonospora halophytica TaxID=47864 RepID=A0A1C5IRC1_9ACTN|nr:class I SAM-dependent methyltransferase [Micromonospora halophytica]SCG60864.1 Methyltransferase domain-containing protein [Micromonospora halophytica]